MKKLTFAVAGAVVALASPAFAQDSGFYASLNTGLATLNNPAFTFTDVSSAPNNVLDTNLVTKDAWGVGGEIGYRFGSLRVGNEMRYQRHKISGITFNRFNGTVLTADDVELLVDELFDDGEGVTADGTTVRTAGSIGRLRQFSDVVNAYYDFDLGAFKPYVGAGAGITWSKGSLIDVSTKSTRFTWQAKAGVSYDVTEQVAVVADYTYRQVSDGRLKDDEPAATYDLGKTKSSYFSVGIRYNF